jgi:hypothetical protein
VLLEGHSFEEVKNVPHVTSLFVETFEGAKFEGFRIYDHLLLLPCHIRFTNLPMIQVGDSGLHNRAHLISSIWLKDDIMDNWHFKFAFFILFCEELNVIRNSNDSEFQNLALRKHK